MRGAGAWSALDTRGQVVSAGLISGSTEWSGGKAGTAAGTCGVPMRRVCGGPKIGPARGARGKMVGMGGKPWIIFDTSGINRLADEADSAGCVKRVREKFRVRLSFLSYQEVIATLDESRRRELGSICRKLVRGGEALYPHHEIFARLAGEHAARSRSSSPGLFDWRAVRVRFDEFEQDVSKGSILKRDCVSAEARQYNQEIECGLRGVWKEAADKFQSCLSHPPAIDELFRNATVSGGPLWGLAADAYFIPTRVSLAREEAKLFASQCPPVRAFLYSTIIHQRVWGFPGVGADRPYKAGVLDVFSAIYLPYCDLFVTADEGQRGALSWIAGKIRLPVQVQLWTDFRRSL